MKVIRMKVLFMHRCTWARDAKDVDVEVTCE
jgi:hypothetical protein